MNPARLHALFNSYFKTKRRQREIFVPDRPPYPQEPVPELYELFS